MVYFCVNILKVFKFSKSAEMQIVKWPFKKILIAMAAAVYEEVNEFVREWATLAHPVQPALRSRRQALAKLVAKWDGKRADFVSKAGSLREVGIYS